MRDATHGNSLSHRAPGSVGQCQTLVVSSKTKMAGHMGAEKVTVQSWKSFALMASVTCCWLRRIAVQPVLTLSLNQRLSFAWGLTMELINGSNAVQVSDVTFATDFNETLVHQAVVAFMAGIVRCQSSEKPR